MTVQDGKIEEALAACRAVRDPSLLEPGCLRYNFFQNTENPANIIFSEEWESQAALDAHFEMPYFGTFFTQVQGFVTGPPSIRVYDVSGFKDL